jgi:hypothetical protein
MTFAVAITVMMGAHSAGAHTQQWYADHLPDAKAAAARCMARLKADDKLSHEDMDECQRAGDAVARSGTFKPSAPRSW